MSGYFITFEGGEGAGKSTQAQLLKEKLQKDNIDVLLTREPGGTMGAEAIRKLLLFGNCDFSLKAEILAHFTARCDHVDQVIKPALQQGKIVLCDRFIDSTLAYQGYGLGKENPDILEFIQKLSNLIDLIPNLTLIFDAPYETLIERCLKRQTKIDAYEQLGYDFHYRVLNGFQLIAKNNKNRCKVIKAHKLLHEVTREVYNLVTHKLSESRYIKNNDSKTR